MGPFVWDSMSFLDLCVCFLHQIREVFGHISSNRFLIPCSLCSPSGILMMQISLHFMLSESFLKLSSFFFKFCFLVVALFGCFFSTLSFKSLIQSSASSNLLFIPSVYVYFRLTFFMVSMSFFHAVEYPYNHYSKLYI